MARTIRALLALTCVLATRQLAAQAPRPDARRPARVDDLFRFEARMPSAALASNGALAIVRTRPAAAATNHVVDPARDIWVQRGPRQQLVNVTKGSADESDWSHPVWSPTGKRLALVSTRGGNYTLWLWEASAKSLRQLATRPLEEDQYRLLRWVDDNRLLFTVLPEGFRSSDPRVTGEPVEWRTAKAGWAKMARGAEPTASVLQAGVPQQPDAQRPRDVLLLDVTKREKPATVASYTPVLGFDVDVQLSPDARVLLIAREVSKNAYGAAQWDGTQEIELRLLDGRALVLAKPLPKDVMVGTHRWSPDGRELVFFASPDAAKVKPVLWRVKVDSGQVQAIEIGALNVVDLSGRGEIVELEWTTAGDPVVLATEGTGKRRDWWLLSRDGRHRNLTSSMASVPVRTGAFFQADGRGTLIGIDAGEIWRLDAARGSIDNLTAKLTQPVTSGGLGGSEVLFPGQRHVLDPIRPGVSYSEYTFRGMNGPHNVFAIRDSAGRASPYLLDATSGAITPVRPPAHGAELTAYHPAAATAVFAAATDTGLFIWRTDVRSGEREQVVAINTFRRSIAEAEQRVIDYTSTDGQPLKARVFLPLGHAPGQRHPLVVMPRTGVYPYLTACDFQFTSANVLSIQIFTAAGYAVLCPSIPPTDERHALVSRTNGVLPAVTRAVELGLADTDRVFVVGGSIGGYMTYALVGLTNRFKAAVAFAGFANLMSRWGVFDPRTRYTERSDQGTGWHENGNGGPPWTDYARWVRNSPITYVDRVETPMLIVQGDMDYVQIQQGEEYFTSLQRQGKRAQFVRYWGEGHSIRSPANLRDAYQRMFAWFDEFGDITRDAEGNIVFEGDRARSRGGAPPLRPQDYARFDLFKPSP